MAEALFETARYRASRLGLADAPRLQRFFEANPEYDVMVTGERPKPNAAVEEIESVPPYPHRAISVMSFDAADGEMAAMAGIVEDLIAKGVGHIGIFVVATRLHGSGAAQEIYEGLEAWMRARGAKWLRLGVVAVNARGERFWKRMGYEEVRVRRDVSYGKLTHDIRVMVKTLAGGSLEDYLALVARDRPDAP